MKSGVFLYIHCNIDTHALFKMRPLYRSSILVLSIIYTTPQQLYLFSLSFIQSLTYEAVVGDLSVSHKEPGSVVSAVLRPAACVEETRTEEEVAGIWQEIVVLDISRAITVS